MRKIVLLCLDTVWKDFFDEYAPQLVDRADIVYGGCRVASSWSASSYISMFIRQLTSGHGAHEYQRNFSVVDPIKGLLGKIVNDQAFCASVNVWAETLFRFDKLFNQHPEFFLNQWLPEEIDDGTADQVQDLGQL